MLAWTRVGVIEVVIPDVIEGKGNRIADELQVECERKKQVRMIPRILA